jgi:hypothetical protein
MSFQCHRQGRPIVDIQDVFDQGVSLRIGNDIRTKTVRLTLYSEKIIVYSVQRPFAPPVGRFALLFFVQHCFAAEN